MHYSIDFFVKHVEHIIHQILIEAFVPKIDCLLDLQENKALHSGIFLETQCNEILMSHHLFNAIVPKFFITHFQVQNGRTL